MYGFSDETIFEGQYGSTFYESANDCNTAAKSSLRTWLNENCSKWIEKGITSGTFEGDSSGIELVEYSETATMRDTGKQIELIAQFWGGKV